jgi:hypothetical protein
MDCEGWFGSRGRDVECLLPEHRLLGPQKCNDLPLGRRALSSPDPNQTQPKINNHERHANNG